ncbi:hypothetical protein L195_g050598 [Trifolium pratense]|uniref:Uncharacterized protein n=1 Tax=Trifolium pratense TaxID=57577 RepID=A0A2K3JUX7_TRIPR|nr:hypothetical protein L195_g050598 [Trifolium pratense]
MVSCVSAQSSWQAAGLSSVLSSAVCQQGSAADRVFALCRNEDYATIVQSKLVGLRLIIGTSGLQSISCEVTMIMMFRLSASICGKSLV